MAGQAICEARDLAGCEGSFAVMGSALIYHRVEFDKARDKVCLLSRGVPRWVSKTTPIRVLHINRQKGNA